MGSVEYEEVLKSVRLIREGMPASVEEFKSMGLARDGVYKRLEFAIGVVLDGLSELAREHDIIALSYKEMVEGLSEKGVIPESVADKAIFLAQLREVLIYDYDLVNDEMAFRDMGEYLEFIETVLTFLEGSR
ncbi:HepT-like ribonuclease domain-containing protein [Thermococcus sp. 18S1]|uniref:DUF86 domain-containing protein n=1 Tax=Thermococcus sp. 18S1 TaxID=1638210 RepID=UPI003211E41A